MGIYNELFSLLMLHVYGVAEPALLSGDQTLTLTILSTIGAIFVVALPFILVWQVLKLFR